MVRSDIPAISHATASAAASPLADPMDESRRLTLDAITDFAYVFDLEGRFRFINKPLLDRWGLTLDQAVGKNFFDLNYAPELAAKLQRQIQEVIQTKEHVIDETPYTNPAGAQGYYQYIFSPVLAPDGSVRAVAGSTRDFTDHKRLEAEREGLIRVVEAERATLAAIIEHAPAFICTLRGPEHVVEIANERYYQLIGRRDIVGKPIRHAFPDIEGQGFFELLDNVYRTGQTFIGNEMPIDLFCHSDNVVARHFINFVYQALRDSDGAVTGIFVHGIDITGMVSSREILREREARLVTSEERLAFATDAAELGTFFCPMPLGEIIWNDTCKEHFWLPPDAVVDFDLFYKIIHPDDRETTRKAVNDAVHSGKSYDVMYRTVSPEGRIRWLRAKGRAYHDRAGNPTRFDGVTLDITEQKNAEAALRASESQFRQIADAMPQIVWAADSNGALDYYNRRWFEYINVPPGNLEAARWDRYVHPDDVERAGTAWSAALVSGNTYQIEFRVRASDGHYCWFLVRAAPLRDDSGNIVRWFGTCTDIQAIKRLTAEREQLLESERRARSDAETANRAKDKFIAVLSHELRTPLSPVVMTIPAIEIDPDLPFKFREDLAMIRRNIDLEVKLIDDLLDLSRVSTGKLRLQLRPVSVHEVVRHAIHSSLSDTGGKHLHVVEKLEAANDCMAADPARLQQVFWNLLRNAVKFTPEGGTITIESFNPPGRQQLIVRICDTGVGIPPEVLPHIFDAFEQGDARVTRQFGGLGLGLAIAKAVVELHGGTLRAHSEGKNRGAAFSVQFNTISSALMMPAAAPPSTESAAPVRPSHILLVEDHPDTARSLARILTGSGYLVKTAHTVHAALQAAAAEPFDILVSDIGLPDASGYELMRKIRALYNIKGVALSGYGMEEDARKSREAGFSEHMVKPINIAQLETVLQRLLNSP